MPTSRLLASSTHGRNFDHYARLVRRLLDVPTALVTLVEEDRQVFPGVVGLKEPYQSERQTPLTHSLCQYVAADQKPLVVCDARREPRLADSMAISDLGVIAYAGWPLRDSDGRAVGSLCAIDSAPRDWSAENLSILEELAGACSVELQAMWRQARDSESLLRSIFDSVNVAIAFYDSSDQLVIANDRAEAAVQAAGFRLDQPPYAGPHVRRADNLTPIPFEDQVIPRALRGDLDGHEMEWIGPPGQQVAIVASSQRVCHSDGQVRGTLVAAHDVTDLARSVIVKDEFITTVSHELRTPLTSILGYLELLSDELDMDSNSIAGPISTIERNANRLLSSVQQLLDTADRRRQLVMTPVDAVSIVRNVIDTFAEKARAYQVELSCRTSQAHWATLDAVHFEQAIENVVSNAIKYNRPGGHVTIELRSDETQLSLDISDTGFGMTPDEVAQACHTFWRADGVLKAAIQGFGIGLSQAKDIIDAHHGRIDIDSTLDSGTRVSVVVPLSPELSIHAGTPRLPPPPVTPVAHRTDTPGPNTAPETPRLQQSEI